MALPDENYVAWQGVETYFVDKDTGEPLSDGYVVFYSDVNRSVLKDVYQQVQLPNNEYSFVNIGSTVNLTAVGTFESPSDGTDIQVYGYILNSQGETELYYLEVYSSGNILQFTREAQPANAGAASTTDLFEGSENQISNPQFVETLFAPSTSNIFTVTGTNTVTDVVPGWSIVTTGSGTVTITQIDLTDISIPSTPPFSLGIAASAGLSSLVLRQQIAGSPRLFGMDFISGSLVARTFGTTAVNLLMDYVASNGYTVNLVNQSTTATGSYSTLINDTASEITTTNADPGSTGYVNIDITIPSTAHVAITSVQIVNAEDANSSIAFVQESTPRQIDHLFHYWKPPLDFKPVPSLLTAWDFSLNPAQLGTSQMITATAAYIWDQTIAVRSGSDVTVTRVSNPDTGGIAFALGTANSFCIMQYLSGAQAKKMLFTDLSVNIFGYTNSLGAGMVARVYLYVGGSTAVVPTLPLLIGALGADGTFVLNNVAGQGQHWSEIPRSGLTVATAAIDDDNGLTQDYGFSGWEITDPTIFPDIDKFCIVVTFCQIVANSEIAVNSISLTPGRIPTRPAPQSTDEVLRECQYYYQKSFLQGTTPVQNAGINTGEFYSVVTISAGNTNFFPVRFSTPMRSTPVNPPVFYNPVVANALIRNFETPLDFTTTALKANTLTANGFMIQGISGAGATVGQSIGVHWTADARLGIV